MADYTRRYLDYSADERRILRAVYEAGFATGTGRPWLIDEDDEDLLRLIGDVTEDWFISLDVSRATFDAPRMRDELPAWLLALPNQK